MRSVILLLICSCSVETPSGLVAQALEPPSCDSQAVQAEKSILSDLSASEYDGFSVRALRRDGRRFSHRKGFHHDVVISSSIAKPVVTVAILDQVARGNLDLDTLAIDVLPDLTSTGSQLDVTLRHLLAVTSGLWESPFCWRDSEDLEAYRECVRQIPAAQSAIRTPGTDHVYQTTHLDLAGEMAVEASTHDTWRELFGAWAADVGIFENVTWNENYIVAASVQFSHTIDDYLEFLVGLRDCTMLPTELCHEMMTDHVPAGSGPTQAKIWFGEDWHWGLGIWLECRSAVHDCTDHCRTITVGAAGQVGYVDWPAGYVYTHGPVWNFTGGLELARSLDMHFAAWSSM